MPVRPLGRSGIDVSTVLLGAGTIGGIGSAAHTWGKGLRDAEALAVLDSAEAHGITVVDTANTYAGGHSEEVVGRWLADHPASGMLVATKVGAVVEADGMSVCLRADAIARNALASLERLGRGSIDLYLAHAPDDATPIGETLEAFARLREDGVVRAVGACNVSAAQLEHALAEAERLRLPRYEWVQNEYSMLARDDERGVLPICREHGLGYTPHSVLCGGILTGRFLPGQPLPQGSAVALRPQGREEQLSPIVLSHVQELVPEAAALGVSVAGLALAWVLSCDSVTAALVAPRRPDQFGMVTEALALDLDPDERERLAAILG